MVLLLSISNLDQQLYNLSFDDLLCWHLQYPVSFWQYYHQKHPIYTLYPLAGSQNEDGLYTRSNGLVYRVFSDLETAKKARIDNPCLYITDEDDPKLLDNYSGIDLLADIYYARAAYYLENGYFERSQRLFIRAFNLDFTPLSANSHIYIDHREKWLGHN